jgi:hypothetical protein
MTEKRTEMEKEYGMLPAKLRAKHKKGMLGISLQRTRDLEALARGEKVPGLNPKLSTKQLQSVKKVQRGKDYKGRGDVPTEKQVKERAKKAKISNVSLPISKPKKFDSGGLIGNQKKLDVDNSGTLTKKDFQMLGNKPTVNKKLGGSIQVSGSNFSGIY